MKHILVVDDELGSRESIKAIFYKIYEVSAVASGKEALQILASRPVDALILDVVMPDMDGLAVLREARRFYPDLPVLMISASSSETPLSEALKIGARACIRKPFDVVEIRHQVADAIALCVAPRTQEVLNQETLRSFPLFQMIGDSPAFRRSIEDARRTTQSDSPVFISGEMGTGKELLARQIHSWSLRCNEPFVPLDCSTVPTDYLKQELFGAAENPAVKKSSTSRSTFDLAGAGTLYLSNVESLPALQQKELSEVIAVGKFPRGGSDCQVPTRTRIMASSRQHPQVLITANKLNKPFFDCFASFPIHVPALRERTEDVSALAYHFLYLLRLSLGAGMTDIEPAALGLMREYEWPGNIREMRNVIERILVTRGAELVLKADFLPSEFQRNLGGESGREDYSSFEDAVSSFERNLIVNALKKSNGVITDAARSLNTTPRVLKYRIDKLGIQTSIQSA